MRRILVTSVAVLLMTTLVFGQTTTMNITYTTTAPATGSPVHHYVWQTSATGTTWTTLATQPTGLSITVAAPVGINILMRVAGVDAQGRQGPWSEVSDPFVPDAGPPGAAGKPVRVP